jgi:hypothetical protein
MELKNNSAVKAAIDAYVSRGEHPGGFVLAVLENDLFAAHCRAGAENTRLLDDIIEYVYNHTPYYCWGSAKATQEWMSGGFRKHGH